MPKSYLVFEKETKFELPVALFFSIKDVADFAGVGYREAFRICHGQVQHSRFGVFVDEFDPAAEGQMYRDHLPPQNTEHKNQKEVQ